MVNTYAKAHHWTFPNIEYVLWAILIGLFVANTVGVPKLFQAGINTYEFWLKLGIVLLGARFVLADVLKLGGISLALVVVEITLSLALMTLLGRIFKLKPKLTSLLAIGSSVCGVSAIIAAKGAIDADDEDSSFAIAAILALGALALFTFPAIAHGLHMNNVAYGLWAGLGVDNTAEAVAAGALYSDAAGKVAVLAKTARNAMIGFVVLAYAMYWAGRGQAENVTNKNCTPLEEVSEVYPRFPGTFAAREFSGLQQTADRIAGKSVEVGIPAHLRRSRPAHQRSRNVKAGNSAVYRRCAGRGTDCLSDVRAGDRRQSHLGTVAGGRVTSRRYSTVTAFRNT